MYSSLLLALLVLIPSLASAHWTEEQLSPDCLRAKDAAMHVLKERYVESEYLTEDTYVAIETDPNLEVLCGLTESIYLLEIKSDYIRAYRNAALFNVNKQSFEVEFWTFDH